MLTLKALNVEVSNNGLKGKDLPKKIKVLSWGKNSTTDGDVYLTDYTVKVFEDNQKKSGREKDVALDFDHSTVPGSKEYVQGQPKSIAAYGNPVLVKGDGLYLEDLEWTPLGEENAKNYKDLSPAALVDSQGVVLGLHSVALTPNGAVKGLKFYSAKGMEDMIKLMAVKDQGQSNSEKITIKDVSDMGGQSGGSMFSADNNGDDDSDNEDTVDKAMCNYDADDHYSKYGDVTYADKENHKYPVDTEKHVRAAWSYINMPKNAGKYSSDKLSAIKSNIKNAAKKLDVGISDSSSDEKTKTMSAHSSYGEQDQYNNKNNMNDTKIKQMAADISSELGMENSTLVERVLYAFLAKEGGLQAESSKQLTTKATTEDGGLKQFSAKVQDLENQVKTLISERDQQNAKFLEIEKNNLVEQAKKEGISLKSLSADTIKKVDVDTLKSILSEIQGNRIPMNPTLRVLSVGDSNGQLSPREKAAAAFKKSVMEATQ